MATQAFVFIGDNYHPRKFLEDLFITLPYAPDLAGICNIVKAAQLAEDSRHIDWACVLVVSDSAPPEQKYYQVAASTSKETLVKNGYLETFFCEREGRTFGHRGVRELVRVQNDPASPDSITGEPFHYETLLPLPVGDVAAGKERGI
jgi:hypothetical protein